MPVTLLVYGVAVILVFYQIARNYGFYCLIIGRYPAGGQEIVRCDNAI